MAPTLLSSIPVAGFPHQKLNVSCATTVLCGPFESVANHKAQTAFLISVLLQRRQQTSHLGSVLHCTTIGSRKLDKISLWPDSEPTLKPDLC